MSHHGVLYGIFCKYNNSLQQFSPSRNMYHCIILYHIVSSKNHQHDNGTCHYLSISSMAQLPFASAGGDGTTESPPTSRMEATPMKQKILGWQRMVGCLIGWVGDERSRYLSLRNNTVLQWHWWNLHFWVSMMIKDHYVSNLYPRVQFFSWHIEARIGLLQLLTKLVNHFLGLAPSARWDHLHVQWHRDHQPGEGVSMPRRWWEVDSEWWDMVRHGKLKGF